MGHKKVCLYCRKAFSFNIYNNTNTMNILCPECGKPAILVNHKFRPPKQDDLKKWEVVSLLVKNGFVFQHIYEEIERGMHLQMRYPTTIEEAKEFIEKYKRQVSKNI